MHGISSALEQLYAFIEGSTKRHGLFKQIQQDESELKSCGTLQSLSTTRWNSRASNCAVLEKTIVVVVKTLESIASDASYPRDTAATAIALRKAMDYEFCVCLATSSELLQVCDVVSKSLQRENIDISMATSLVEDLLDELKGQRQEGSTNSTLILSANLPAFCQCLSNSPS